MRSLTSKDFEKVKLGTFTAQSFLLVAALLATERGLYWYASLAAGVSFDWWIMGRGAWRIASRCMRSPIRA
jgi:hypothetical protein